MLLQTNQGIQTSGEGYLGLSSEVPVKYSDHNRETWWEKKIFRHCQRRHVAGIYVLIMALLVISS